MFTTNTSVLSLLRTRFQFTKAKISFERGRFHYLGLIRRCLYVAFSIHEHLDNVDAFEQVLEEGFEPVGMGATI